MITTRKVYDKLCRTEVRYNALRGIARGAERELKRLGADVNWGGIGHHKIYHALKKELKRKP